MRKQCFFMFLVTLVQSLQKIKKPFLELFAWRSVKSVRKQCFFMFFETFCSKFAYDAQKTAFFGLFARRSVKIMKL